MRSFSTIAPLFLLSVTATFADVGSLVDNSPFVPEALKNRKDAPVEVQTPEAPPSTLQFTGYYESEGKRYFSVIDTQSQVNRWIVEGEEDKDSPFKFSDFNPDSLTLSVVHLGRPLNISLNQRSAPSGSVVAPTPAGNSSSNGSAIRTPGSNRNNNNAGNARRVVIPRRR